MQARVTARPQQEVIAAIQALDLEPVKLRVMDPELGEGWTRDYADSIETAYKTYLTMLVKYQDHAEDILLSKDVDEFWHTHILQTMKYADDCDKAFGAFLHHQPHIGEVTEADQEKRAMLAEKTRRLYQMEFGSENAGAAAWSGLPVRADQAAMSGVAIRKDDAAMSGVAVQGKGAAMSGVAIRKENAAMSGVSVRAENAAMSGVAIRGETAAMSGVAIRARSAAMSGVVIRKEDAAMSGVAIRSDNAAMSGVAVSGQGDRKAVAAGTAPAGA
jgi:hypothetical protein